MSKHVWLVLSAAAEEHGWIILGVFSARGLALAYAATVDHEVYVSIRELDVRPDVPPFALGVYPLTRGELLAEGLDFVLTEAGV